MNENFTKLLSAEEVQRAFAEGMYVQARQGDTNWLGAWPTDNLADIEKFFREGWTFRAPAKPPTPEAERRELHAMAADTGPLTVAALISAELEAERPALVGGEDGVIPWMLDRAAELGALAPTQAAAKEGE